MNLLVLKLNLRLPLIDMLTKLALTSQKKFKWLVIIVPKKADVKETDLATETKKRSGKERKKESGQKNARETVNEEIETSGREESNGIEKNAKGEIESTAREGNGQRKGGKEEIGKHVCVEREMNVIVDRGIIETVNVKRTEGIAIEEMWIMSEKEIVIGQGGMITTKIEQERKKSRLQPKMEILLLKMCKFLYALFNCTYATILETFLIFPGR